MIDSMIVICPFKIDDNPFQLSINGIKEFAGTGIYSNNTILVQEGMTQDRMMENNTSMQRRPGSVIVVKEELENLNRIWIAKSSSTSTTTTTTTSNDKNSTDLAAKNNNNKNEENIAVVVNNRMDKFNVIVGTNTNNKLPAGDDKRSIRKMTTKETKKTPLEKAISILSCNALDPNRVIPALFSVLGNNSRCKTNTSTSTTSSTTNTDTSSNNKLKQIEWHAVLLLELWATTATLEAIDKDALLFLDVCVRHIQQMIEEEHVHRIDNDRRSRRSSKKRRRRNEEKDGNTGGEEKESSRKRNRNKANTRSTMISKTATVSSDASSVNIKHKETMILDHLVRLFSRAPFLLPIETPLRDFLCRCLNRKRHWERLPQIISHIFETFEVRNPFLSISDSSEVDDNNTDKRSLSVGGSMHQTTLPSVAGVMVVPKKKSRRELQLLALAAVKNNKKKRLTALSSKKKRRGSHFHRNIQDISKLLNKNKTTPSLSASIVIADDTNNIMSTNSGSSNKTLNAQQINSSKTNKVSKLTNRKEVNYTTKIKDSVNVSRDNSSSKKIGNTRQSLNQQPYISNSKTSDDDIINGNKRNISNNDKAFAVTPIKGSSIGDNNSTSTSIVANDKIVKATPIATAAGASFSSTQLCETVVGETPTYGGGVGVGDSTLVSNLFMSSSPPALLLSTPAGAKRTTKGSTKINTDNVPPPHQPLKLFGTVKLVKRKETNLGKNDRNGDNNNYPINEKVDAGDTHDKKGKVDIINNRSSSSIKLAHAYLRRKST